MSIRAEELIATRGKLGDEPFGPEFCEVVRQRGEGVAIGGATEHGEDSRVEFGGGEGVATGNVGEPHEGVHQGELSRVVELGPGMRIPVRVIVGSASFRS